MAHLTNDFSEVATGYEPYFYTKKITEEDYVKVAVLPDNQEFEILIDGTGSGTMSVVVGYYDGSDITQVETFANYHVSDTTLGYLNSKNDQLLQGNLVLNVVAVQGVALNQNTITLTTTDTTEALIATVTPRNATNHTVNWTSSDPNVAMVSDTGVITAMSNGTATITVTTVDGNFSTSCEVTVNIPSEDTSYDCSTGYHTLEKKDAIAATCNSTGTVAHWHCSACGKSFGDNTGTSELLDITTPKNPKNHTGGTEIRNSKPATATEPGYTGDEHCLGCGVILERGEEIPIHDCIAGSEWFYDENNHWNVCAGHKDCQEHMNDAAHTGGTATTIERAICSVCGQPYGEVLEKNCSTGYHTLEKKDAIAATCNSIGTVAHWHCSVCGKNFGDNAGTSELTDITTPKNPQNHAGGTEIRNSKPATATEPGYTGDKHCLGCGVKLESGSVIPVHECVAGSEWFYDESSHWNHCTGHSDCQKHLNESAHTGGTATVTEKAICSVCGQRYGEVLSNDTSDEDTGNQKPETPETPPQEPETPEYDDSDNDDFEDYDPPVIPSLPSTPENPVEIPWENPFADVAEDAWYYDAVKFVSQNGIMNGMANDAFTPDATTTRAMIWTMLARLEGVDTTGGASWYEKGMAWAVENGISDGTNANSEITREQLAVMLYRYAGSPQVKGLTVAFDDFNVVSSYAVNAVQWAIENGILNGMGDGTLNPGGTATRAQVAKMLMEYLK
ncbi:MAG: S-layer homology domain-containing protein [Oscillospiraceae bacterium]|nr:S-layer homology domain-containing protein [Oscillospiraceae bacterium]